MTDDPSRQAATSPYEYSLTIEEAAVGYEHAGHPRTTRSIQRYCAKGHLDCLRQETPFGDKYMITPASVAGHIAQIEELASTSGRGLSRQDATPFAVQASSGETRDERRHVRPVAANYVERVGSENDFLRQQISVKDEQIKDLTERARETNHPIAGLQNMLTPLLPRGPDTHGDASMGAGAAG